MDKKPAVDEEQRRDDDPRRRLATAMAEAAGSWLAMLSADQRRLACGPGPAADSESDEDRRRWFYTPVDHGGLDLHGQRPAQQQAAMRLVASGLSVPAYVTMATIMGLENVLDQREGFPHEAHRERYRDPGLYYLRVFGDPGGRRPWGWRFGGHHVSLNNLVVDGSLMSSTPLFLGSNPAVAPLLGGAELRPLAAVEDLARELVESLPADARRAAVLSPEAPSDLLTRNLPRLEPVETDEDPVGYTARPRGVAARHLDTSQRDLLRLLLRTYLDRVPDEMSPAARFADDATLDLVHLAWAGPTLRGEPHYYRLQGPGLLIEWDNVQNGANHAHSVWRDPDADFGLDVLAAHRARHHEAQTGRA